MKTIMAILATIISAIVKAILEHIGEQSRKPKVVVREDVPAPKHMRDHFEEKIKAHPGYGATVNRSPR